MLMRLNLDKIQHPIHCYYPASGKRYFDRLRYGTIYHEAITVIEHPIEYPGGLVHQDENFTIEARFLDHGIDNLGWRVSEPDTIRFHKDKLQQAGIHGSCIRDLEKQGWIEHQGQRIQLSDVSYVKHGDSIAVIIDTRPCAAALQLAKNTRLLLCESTYLSDEHELALHHKHMTANEAAQLAKEAQANTLVLTHFSARYPDHQAFEIEAKKIFPNTIAAKDLQKISFRDKRGE
jgi:ribonuclease Z